MRASPRDPRLAVLAYPYGRGPKRRFSASFASLRDEIGRDGWRRRWLLPIWKGLAHPVVGSLVDAFEYVGKIVDGIHAEARARDDERVGEGELFADLLALHELEVPSVEGHDSQRIFCPVVVERDARVVPARA